MPFDFNTAVRKRYVTLPVQRDFIPSSGTPTPQILWVGCSDSFIIETETLDVLPEELFVHRNLGNLLHNRDLSSESALDWCLDLLKVNHIVVCGHYDCALIRESDANEVHGWHKLHRTNTEYLSKTNQSLNAQERDRILEEIYVLAETDWIRTQPNVKKAISNRGLQVHAFVYDKAQNRCVRLVESEIVNGTK
ncbi:carbonic anhydrase [Stipitochalara longipes BDJ]|nr:carbonic anhydrase [Stipitochalara longipes BDJ]